MRFLISALLLATGVFSLDCPVKACFGQPQGCVPGSNCQLVFKFETDGSVDLYLRDFVDPHAYAAFPVGENENETYTYLICLPHSKTVLKATAKLGEPIKVINYGAGVVNELGQNYFSCSYPSSELPTSFRRDKSFYVTTGQFVDNLVIYDGHQLYSFDSEDDSAEDADYEPIYTEPISGTIRHGNDNSKNVYTGDESKQANDAIDVIENIANKNEDSGLEDLELMLGSQTGNQNGKKQVSRQNEVEEDDESLEEELETTTRRPTRGHRKSSSIPSRRSTEVEDEGESDEDDDWEAAARELERKDRKTQIRRRQHNDQQQKGSRNQYQEDDDKEEDHPRRKSPKRKSRNDENDEDEEMEDDEEFDDDEDDSAINNFNIFLCTSIVIIVLAFTF